MVAYDITLLCNSQVANIGFSVFICYVVAYQLSDSPGRAGQGFLIDC